MNRRSFLGPVGGVVAGGREAAVSVVQKAGIGTIPATVGRSISEHTSGVDVDYGTASPSKSTLAKALAMRKTGLPKAVVDRVKTKAKVVEAIDVDIGVLRSVSASHMVYAQRRRQVERALDVDTHIRRLVNELAIDEAQKRTGLNFWFW